MPKINKDGRLVGGPNNKIYSQTQSSMLFNNLIQT
jgi:hypothetical protein